MTRLTLWVDTIECGPILNRNPLRSQVDVASSVALNLWIK